MCSLCSCCWHNRGFHSHTAVLKETGEDKTSIWSPSHSTVQLVLDTTCFWTSAEPWIEYRLPRTDRKTNWGWIKKKGTQMQKENGSRPIKSENTRVDTHKYEKWIQEETYRPLTWNTAAAVSSQQNQACCPITAYTHDYASCQSNKRETIICQKSAMPIFF